MCPHAGHVWPEWVLHPLPLPSPSSPAPASCLPFPAELRSPLHQETSGHQPRRSGADCSLQGSQLPTSSLLSPTWLEAEPEGLGLRPVASPPDDRGDHGRSWVGGFSICPLSLASGSWAVTSPWGSRSTSAKWQLGRLMRGGRQSSPVSFVPSHPRAPPGALLSRGTLRALLQGPYCFIVVCVTVFEMSPFLPKM